MIVFGERWRSSVTSRRMRGRLILILISLNPGFHLKFCSNNYTYLDLFRTPEMRKISILVILTWAVISCIFDTTVRNISNLNFEFYLSFMIAASMELPADLASIWGINWLGRRWSASLSLIGCGLTMLPCAFITGMNN